MDSISPSAAGTAGNQLGLSGVRTRFDTLMERFWFGKLAHSLPAATTRAPTYRRSSYTPTRLVR